MLGRHGSHSKAALCHVSEYASAPQIGNDDPRLRTERVAIDVDWGKLDCYVARPDTDTEPHPGVIVAHDKLGLTPHFEEAARRLALEGFVTSAPSIDQRSTRAWSKSP
ncbi:dienelactone hydrolase family protein [Rhizobium sp. T1473]|uniref:dienelactone hydrolase family protein n=1 Tax=unclassified Rhizobium TaxID=2613769 RepID=UPI001AAEAC22|nr:dienelactone hydrolase family protein [Rhizobium sp. T1473]